MLLFIICAFFVASGASARRIKATLQTTSVVYKDDAHGVQSTGKALLKQILYTAATVFASFLLRSVYSIMQAVSYQLQNTGIDISNTEDCPMPNTLQNGTARSFCHPCYNIYTHMTFWMTRTPAFQLTVVLISSPVALCVALWGMTSKQLLRHMRLALQERSAETRKHSMPSTRISNLLENQ